MVIVDVVGAIDPSLEPMPESGRLEPLNAPSVARRSLVCGVMIRTVILELHLPRFSSGIHNDSATINVQPLNIPGSLPSAPYI